MTDSTVDISPAETEAEAEAEAGATACGVRFLQLPTVGVPVHAPVDSPIGTLLLTGWDTPTGLVLSGLQLPLPAVPRPVNHDSRESSVALAPAIDQLEQYFSGQRREFSLDVAVTGTVFQERVWQTLADIPYGATLSYGELANEAGYPGAFRAAGSANGRNPIAVVIPCHRVIAAGRGLGGYGGGLERKRALLHLEGVDTPGS